MKPIRLGQIELPSNVILAPMAGVTDLPFRKIVREFGDFLMFSEMIASNAVIRHVSRSYKMIEGAEDPYTSVQIVGADPVVMAEASRLSVDLGASFIDINMGCPVKKIVKSDAGSALMRDEKLAESIIKAVVRAVDVPITLKMRLGWDHDHKNAPKIAKIAEDLGVQIITVHGRTRSQLYTGKADWKAIREVKESVSIPVIANGDIIDVDSAKIALEESGADGVMIGRGSLGSPWVLQQVHNYLNNNQNDVVFNKMEVAKKHILNIFDFYEEQRAVLLCRKALMYYCKSIPNAATFRRNIVSLNSKTAVFDIFEEIFSIL